MRIRTASLLTLALLAVTVGAASYVVTAQDKPKGEGAPAARDGEKGETEKPVRTLKPNEVARVNDRVITAEEFIQRLVLREKITTDPDTRTARWALDSLVIDELLIQEGTRLGAVAKRRWLNEESQKLMDAFDAELQQINKVVVARGSTAYSKEEFVDQRYGMAWSEFETYLEGVARDNLMRRQVVNYWRLSTDSADAGGIKKRNLEKLKKVRQRLLAGEKLEKIAPTESEDMHTREGAGRIGTAYRNDGSFDPVVSDVFWKLEVGAWSEPIKTDSGYWIVCKLKSYPGNEAPFFQLQEKCLGMPTADDNLMLKWRYSVASSGNYTYEQRMPGWDCLAGEE